MYIFTPNTLIESSKVNANFAEVTDIQSPWLTWVPTVSNLNIGTGGVATYKYKKIGKTVFVSVAITLGTSPSITGSPEFTLPVIAKDTNAMNFAQFADVTFNLVFGSVRLMTTNSMRIDAHNTASTYTVGAGITSTVPFTWAVNDQILFNLTYEAV